MKKKALFSLICFLLALQLLSLPPAFALESSAETETVQDTAVDTAAKTYRIYTAKGLQQFASDISVCGGNTYHGWSIYLESDVDLNPGWTAGSGAAPVAWTPINNFKGEFYGQGHTIRGMYVSTAGNAGFFASAYDATVRDLSIRNAYFESTANMAVGSVIGYAVSNDYGTTSYLCNLYSDAAVVNSVNGSNKGVGGIVGLQGEKVQYENVVFAGSVSAYQAAGGIVGKNAKAATLKDCANFGTVSMQNREGAGIIGYVTAEASLSACLSFGKVRAAKVTGTNTSQYVGALAYLRGSGTYAVTLNDCYFDPAFNAYGKGVGVAYWGNAAQAGNFTLGVRYHGEQTGSWTKTWNADVQNGIRALPETVSDLLNDGAFGSWVYVTEQLMPWATARLLSQLPAATAYVQQSVQSSDIRLIGLFRGNPDAYQTVGFRVSVTVDGVEKVTNRDIGSGTVYGSVLENSALGMVSYAAQDLGADFLYALEIAGIPVTGTVRISVRSFARDSSGKMTFDRAATVTVTDGTVVPAGAM